MYEKREEWIYYKKPWAINGKYEKKSRKYCFKIMNNIKHKWNTNLGKENGGIKNCHKTWVINDVLPLGVKIKQYEQFW